MILVVEYLRLCVFIVSSVTSQTQERGRGGFNVGQTLVTTSVWLLILCAKLVCTPLKNQTLCSQG